MKKWLLPILLILVLMISACGKQTTEKSKDNNTADNREFITYQSEDGPIEVPANPKRVVVLSHIYSGSVMSLGVNLVGVDQWSKMNPNFQDQLKDVEQVSEENLEKIIELNPDLIIALSSTKNLDKLKEIAPTVTFTYGKLNYLEQHIEIGKLLNKEKEARKWVEDFQARAQKSGEEIKAKIGEDATISIIENDEKQLYVFGDNYGRGGEILYQEMKLKMPEKVKEMTKKDGYYAISPEVLSDYVGDYLILSKYEDGDTSYVETETFKNLPAVKNNRVFEVDAKGFYFNDPISLEHQLDFIEKSFLNK
ncbi:iron-hydroxamate ABC transporter substrate-binding protein [Neobacillus sedimentimangrovi]|jgi:iron complex transport system substrate-binding protein|uniref:Iron-hydroxamate ABC transporter substrate-binding protein n=1 Tax=Neobacillus sedimentimangrovi TaxID=2699460 RepID=A0ABS8QJS7_9BACI|nr:iron-hydroxamate ABC transporter substrate-binding protein [Neobacillus sedimentimangrovi]AIM15971.1 ABC transporter substrate-binding protein [Bacillus sp. X1(2014)]MCD4839511.1 iron-hydroxamate ABC transporter substrate-binding protein [Neobacillus sedimentimangrovi]